MAFIDKIIRYHKYLTHLQTITVSHYYSFLLISKFDYCYPTLMQHKVHIDSITKNSILTTNSLDETKIATLVPAYFIFNLGSHVICDLKDRNNEK